MQRLSSIQTRFIKKIFPPLFFGFLGLFTLLLVVSMVNTGKWQLPLFLFPLAMALIGHYFMKKDLTGLVDEVWDDGDALIVKNDGTEERLALANISSVQYKAGRMPRATLILRTPCRLGPTVQFLPAVNNLCFRDKVVEELRARIK